MFITPEAHYSENGFLILEGKVGFALYGGFLSMGDLPEIRKNKIAVNAKKADLTVIEQKNTLSSNVIFLDAGYNHATAVKIAILSYDDMPENIRNVFTAILQYLSPSNGLPVRLDCDLRDLERVIVKEGDIDLKAIPVIKVKGSRPWPAII